MSDAEVATKPGKARRAIARPVPKVDKGGVRYIDKIVVRNVNDLKFNDRNSRVHSEQQVKAIATSIEQFGFTTPVLIDSDDVIIAGHGRVLAARQLHMPKVPTIDGSYLTEAERRAYLVADNAIPLSAGWDLNVLIPELDTMKAGGLDLASLGMASLYDLVPHEPDEAPARASRNPRSPSSGTGMVIAYNVIFDDTDQQQAWFKFLRGLKTKYPQAETIGARLQAFLAEHGQ